MPVENLTGMFGNSHFLARFSADNWLVSFTPFRYMHWNTPDTYWIRGRLGPSVCLNVLGKRKISYSYRDSKRGPPFRSLDITQTGLVCIVVCTATIQLKYFCAEIKEHLLECCNDVFHCSEISCNWPVMKGTQRSGVCREFYSRLSCIEENAAAWTEGCIIWDATP